MADKFVSERNLKFLLYEVFELEGLTKLPFFQDHNREVFDIVLDTALRMSRDLLYPCFEEMDKRPPVLENGQVRVHPMVRAFMKEFGEGGWLASSFPREHEGQQLPTMLSMACNHIFAAANFSATGFSLLTTGAAHLILSFGSEDLRKAFVPHMLAGKWQGTMALTEPQAGSSLSDITCRALPTDRGYYAVRGQKIFISAGDHDGVDNVIHLMLARLKGAPLGTKGVSLFVVPKLRINGDGTLESNDVNVAGIYHKLGYRGCPITQLSIGENDDCRGYLVGEPNKGLSYMFQMMNEARIGVGMQATSIASAAYYASLEYAKERPQGRKLSEKDPGLPQLPIIEHSDVKRMLLFQRSVSEGALSLILFCSRLTDLVKDPDETDLENNTLLLNLLTPIAKSYPSEMGILSVSQGLQVLGGYGYCDEFPLQQHFRDMRIHPIHEGTTGIQAMDLLGRKAVMQNGKAMQVYFQQLQSAVDIAGEIPDLDPYADKLREAMDSLRSVTMFLVEFAVQGNPDRFLADATLYLEFFGIITIAWQWLLQGICAHRGLTTSSSEADRLFYLGKIATMSYFFHYELPKIKGLTARLQQRECVTYEISIDLFSD